MTQVPAWRTVTVEPSMVQALRVVAGSTEKVTGLPESPPVALTV